ncbi:MAG: hypothetical protein ACKVP3_12590 [Hyphomicrobiaceae bacterium]
MTTARLDQYLSAPITRDFIQFAQERGHASRDELRLYLPLNVNDAEMELAVAMLAQLGVNVHRNSPPTQPGGPVTELRELLTRLRSQNIDDKKEPPEA